MTDAPTAVVSMTQMEKVKMNGVVLVLTCMACPEQYDAFISGDKVGYFRLRNGYFRVEHLPSEETVYESDTRGDGVFGSEERFTHLSAGTKALFRRHMGCDI